MNERAKLLKDVQCLDFAAHDAALFLDINPTDPKALAYRNDIAKQAASARLFYETRFAPLTHNACNHAENWRWVDEPWPWEYQGKEGK
ncbi:MAG: spore coat protein CotJB [Oscillospiraceae bacterium]|nr:spore coat protein CotJB [Oscillospiraceae bacterium]